MPCYLLQQGHQPVDRQSHHIVVTTVDFSDQGGAQSLNSVSTGFVHRFAGIDIPLYLLIKKRGKSTWVTSDAVKQTLSS